MECIYNVPKYSKLNDLKKVLKIFKKYPMHCVDIVDNFGRTAFHYAAKNNNLPLMKYLINLGANVDKVDNDGINALQLAIMSDSDETAAYLIDIGINPNDFNSIDNNSLLHLAILNDNSYIANKLLLAGADPLFKNYKNYDSYQTAQQYFDEDELKLFERNLDKMGYDV
jgi:ankyrin repeat protein